MSGIANTRYKLSRVGGHHFIAVTEPWIRRGHSPGREEAAMRWLVRYLTEGSPTLRQFAEITTSSHKRES
jgi:hypothetical protein